MTATQHKPAWPTRDTQRRFFQDLLARQALPAAPPLACDAGVKPSVALVFRALLRLEPIAGVRDDDSREVLPEEVRSEAQAAPEDDMPSLEQSWALRLRQGLSKTRGRLAAHVSSLLLGVGAKIDAKLFEDIESELLAADVGIAATERLMDQLQVAFTRNPKLGPDDLYAVLRTEMQNIFAIPGARPNPLIGSERLAQKPFVLLIVGVNGVGKTTTIGKLAKLQQHLGRKVLLAAGDTFRAAAIDQLKTWGERLGVPVIAQQPGADSAAVIFDAYRAAQARGVDVLIADTAGRLHTQNHLMDELRKVKRVLQKIDAAAPHAVLLVLDAGNGQNALNQARVFHETMSVSGIALTKLDGTARGGISFAICETLKLPLWFIGVGEQADDLRPFVAEDFVGALLRQEPSRQEPLRQKPLRQES